MRRSIVVAVCVWVPLLSSMLLAQESEGPKESDSRSDASGSITAHVFGLDKQPVQKSRIVFWEAIGADDDVRFAWNDGKTGLRWRHIKGAATGDKMTSPALKPGTYRVVATAGHHESTPVGISEPIVLEGDRMHSSIDVHMIPGSTVRLRATDAKSRAPISNIRTRLIALDSALPFDLPAKRVRGMPGVMEVQHAPPGRYRVEVSSRADHPEDPEYVLVGEPPEISVEQQAAQEIALSFESRKLSADEIAKRWPWIVQGRVTDERGRPVSGATIHAHCGMGTLLQTGATMTDEDGRYRLQFHGVIRSVDDDPNLQFANIRASKPGTAEKNLNRQGSLAMATRLPEVDVDWAKPGEILLPNTPHELNFTLVPSAQLRIRLRGATRSDGAHARITLTGPELPPGASVYNSETADEWGDANFQDVPLNYEWRLTVHRPDRSELTSQPFRISRPYQNWISVWMGRDPSGIDVLAIERVEDPLGRDVTAEVVGDDPFTHPPATPEQQSQARDFIRKFGETNRYWLGLPPVEVPQYSFDFLNGPSNPSHYDVDPSQFGLTPPRGVVFDTSLSNLVARPDQAVFRVCEFGEEIVHLSYTLKEDEQPVESTDKDKADSKRVPRWRMTGELFVDPRTLTVREHRTLYWHEYYHDFVRVDDQHIVPQVVEMKRETPPNRRWKFGLYKPGLWLFDHDIPSNKAKQPHDRLANLMINGRPAELMPTEKLSP